MSKTSTVLPENVKIDFSHPRQIPWEPLLYLRKFVTHAVVLTSQMSYIMSSLKVMQPGECILLFHRFGNIRMRVIAVFTCFLWIHILYSHNK